MNNKTIKRFYDIIKPYIKILIVIIILAIIVDALTAIRPFLIKTAIEEFMQNKTYLIEFNKFGKKLLLSISHIGILYVIICLIENLLAFFVIKTTAVVSEKALNNTRKKIFEFSQKANIKFHDKTPSGKIFVRITSDTDDLATFFEDVFVSLFQDIFYIIIITIIMFKLSIKLSLIVYAIVFICAIISYIFTKKANKAYDLIKNIRTKLNTFLAETIYGAKTIKIFNIQNIIEKENNELTKELKDKFIYAARFSAPLSQILYFFMYLTIAIIISICVKNLFGISIGAGILYIFITYIKELFEPINKTFENIESVQEAVVCLNKIYDLIEENSLEEFNSGITLNEVKGKIEFKHVWFKYNENDENWILKDISFTIEPTETIALVGKTGSGKTTITNLVNRFYDIQKGEILIDGVNIKDINLDCLRKMIGNILQDPFIFSGTIKENVELYNEMTEEQVNKAIDLASSRDFINSLPNGINEMAVERGDNFSVGQKQLIAFARIFALNPSIFILDEATANIDTTTEKLIQNSINILSKEKTAIFIAHRLSTIVNVDKILVLKDGEIVEEGTHSELMSKKGYYANLYNSYYESLV